MLSIPYYKEIMGHSTARMYLASEDKANLLRHVRDNIDGRCGEVDVDGGIVLYLRDTSSRNMAHSTPAVRARLPLEQTKVHCHAIGGGMIRAQVLCQQTGALIASITPCQDTTEHCVMVQEPARLDAYSPRPAALSA
ncbi:MAG: hypothetical protein UY35_C0017G0010 [Candidatus Saccharibacteria bacterium GW2011_GWC2_48_9]|nr:MAG: hypothetical protein UY35_C0017G0010 [Candidatus Saccharibacteria bacterium GW2011_GWC2_48_9]